MRREIGITHGQQGKGHEPYSHHNPNYNWNWNFRGNYFEAAQLR